MTMPLWADDCVGRRAPTINAPATARASTATCKKRLRKLCIVVLLEKIELGAGACGRPAMSGIRTRLGARSIINVAINDVVNRAACECPDEGFGKPSLSPWYSLAHACHYQHVRKNTGE